MKEHSPFGGSALWRRKECPPSYLEEKGLPDRQTDASRMGDRVHFVSSCYLRQIKARKAVGLTAEQLDSEALIGLQEEEKHFAEDCLGFFMSRLRALEGEYNIDRGKIFVEEEVSFFEKPDDPLSPLLAWGTMDAGIVVPEIKHIELFEWKFGRKEFDQNSVG